MDSIDGQVLEADTHDLTQAAWDAWQKDLPVLDRLIAEFIKLQDAFASDKACQQTVQRRAQMTLNDVLNRVLVRIDDAAILALRRFKCKFLLIIQPHLSDASEKAVVDLKYLVAFKSIGEHREVETLSNKLEPFKSYHVANDLKNVLKQLASELEKRIDVAMTLTQHKTSAKGKKLKKEPHVHVSCGLPVCVSMYVVYV